MDTLQRNQFVQVTLADLFDWVDQGKLALPELQRPAVWQDSKVPELLDSVYRDYPFGAMLLWTPVPSEAIRSRAWKFATTIDGAIPVPDKFLVDGQQRLAAFYRALHGPVSSDHERSLPVAFHAEDEEFALVDGQIKSKLADPDRHCWYLLRDLLRLPQEELERLGRRHGRAEGGRRFGERLGRLRPPNVSVAIYEIVNRTYREVVDIFDRVNRGTPVKESQKVLASLSAVCPGIVGRVEEYLERMVDVHGADFDLDLFVGALALVARGYAEIEPLHDHYGDDEDNGGNAKVGVESDVRATQDALSRAFDFLGRRLGLDSLKRVPNPRGLLCLTYAMSTGAIPPGDDIAERQAAHWMSRSLLTGYHGDARRYRDDIAALREAKGGLPFARLKTNLRAFAVQRELDGMIAKLRDADYVVTRQDTLFCFLYGMLKMSGAASFPSQRPMWPRDRDAARTPTTGWGGTALQVHHINPIAQLEKLYDATDADDWLERKWFHDIANLTFLFGEDNFAVGERSIDYLRSVDPEVRKQHFIGDRDYRPGDYQQFIKDRRQLMCQALVSYLDQLKCD